MQPCYLIYVEHFGIFTGISQSFSFIAEKFIKRTRTVWNTRMQMLIDDGSEINWIKLILLPFVTEMKV